MNNLSLKYDPIEASKALTDFILFGEEDILTTHPKLWEALSKAINDEDVRVREQFVKSCEEFMIKKPKMAPKLG